MTDSAKYTGLRLPSFISNDMVLQQGIRLPLWGWDKPGEAIVVTFGKITRKARADKTGKWTVTLPPQKAGGPFEMMVVGSNTLTVTGILVGEVWVCSGQSNMEMVVQQSDNPEQEAACAKYPLIRLFTAGKVSTGKPQEDVPGAWSPCQPGTVGNFSAVAYFFGRELHRRLKVPVGLINTSWGGTLAEAWTSREGLVRHPKLKPIVDGHERGMANFAKAQEEYIENFNAWQDKYIPKDPGNQGFAKGWADPAKDDAKWPVMNVPCVWQGAGLPFNGVVWFRKTVHVPPAWAGKDLTLGLGPCDDFDTTYFNNVQIGAVGKETPMSWSFPRVYKVPGRLVKAGANLITVRIFDHMGGGGLTGTPAQMFLTADGIKGSRPSPLAGSWRYQVEHNFGMVQPPPSPQPPMGPDNPNAPSALYNGMIAPFVPFAIRGAIWYQGESNADRAHQYRTLFPAMIADWRRNWKQGPFAFHLVQLANFMVRQEIPRDSAWAELREAQLLTLRVRNTGMAVAIDIGDAIDIHPKNKQDVGLRLALAALHGTYGLKKIVPSGPSFRKMNIAGDRIVLSFDHVGGGLVAKGNRKLTGFAIAGKDRKFVWANAIIKGKTIEVFASQVDQPVAVRYAWDDNPACNLYNREQLPASPFRTDNWPGVTRPRK